MKYSLKLLSPPAVEPVSLGQALNQCRVNPGEEDDTFMGYIRAGRDLAEQYQWRAYMPQSFELSFDVLPEMPFDIPRAPLIEVESVSVFDKSNVEHVVSLDDLFIDDGSEPARITFNDGKTWPTVELRSMSAVKIKFTAGYSGVDRIPATVKQAILFYVGYVHENRAAEISEIPSAFYDLLRPDRMYK